MLCKEKILCLLLVLGTINTTKIYGKDFPSVNDIMSFTAAITGIVWFIDWFSKNSSFFSSQTPILSPEEIARKNLLTKIDTLLYENTYTEIMASEDNKMYFELMKTYKGEEFPTHALETLLYCLENKQRNTKASIGCLSNFKAMVTEKNTGNNSSRS